MFTEPHQAGDHRAVAFLSLPRPERTIVSIPPDERHVYQPGLLFVP
jgi:hypothetical protein